LLDRFDLIVHVGRVESSEYSGPVGEPSADVAARVAMARAVQIERGQINRHLVTGLDGHESPDSCRVVAAAIDSALLTARGADRVRRVARTIADLAGADRVEEHHTAEAIGLRGEWRDAWPARDDPR
jgi:magnesium chelatase family protein